MTVCYFIKVGGIMGRNIGYIKYMISSSNTVVIKPTVCVMNLHDINPKSVKVRFIFRVMYLFIISPTYYQLCVILYNDIEVHILLQRHRPTHFDIIYFVIKRQVKDSRRV